MDASEQIKKFEEFFDQPYKREVLTAIGKGQKFVVVEFKDLLQFDTKIAEELLDNPDETVKAAEVAIESLDLPSDNKNFRVRFADIPETQKIMVNEIRSEHIGKLLTISGIVRQKSDVRPQVTTSRFECPNCGNVISVLQIDTSFREPDKCGCGRKGKFRLLSKELVDAQAMVLEESPDELEGGEQPKRLNIFLKEDLVSPITEKRTNPGGRIVVVGVLKEVPVIVKGTKSTRFDLLLEANYTEAVEEDFYQIQISKDEEKKILELSQDPQVFEKLASSIVPTIHGYERIKEALLLQLLGGVHKKRSDGGSSRGDCHILLVGDPGAGKSAMLKRISAIAPKGRYVAGKGASGAGLTAAVVKDEFLGGWSLEAGALVLSNNGMVCIDEMDKMTDEDRAAMHEALEQQCYHYETEIMFANGSTQKIGQFVEQLMELNREKIVLGVNCEILSVPSLPQVLTTDFSTISPVRINRVSRHKAPEVFCKISYNNGRSITVTPEHPIYYVENGEITTCKAQDAKEGMFAPSPSRLPTFAIGKDDLQANNYGLFLGLQCSEGYSYKNNKHRYAEFGISNTDPVISRLAYGVMKSVFSKEPQTHIRSVEATRKAKLALVTTRVSSKMAYQKLKQEVPELLQKATKKRVPNKVKSGSQLLKRAFVQGFFLGDGFVDQERTGFTTSSYLLAQDMQQLLLELEIYSYITTEERETAKYYKVIVSGKQSYEQFYNMVPSIDVRKERILQLLQRSALKNNNRDVLPNSYIVILHSLLKEFRLDDGYFNKTIETGQNAHRSTCWHYLKVIEERFQQALDCLKNNNTKQIRKLWSVEKREIAKVLSVSYGSIWNIEKPSHKRHYELLSTVKKIAERKKNVLLPKIQKLHRLLTGEVRFVRITNVERVQNKEHMWAYDITVEPTHSFISQNLVLHNSISIAKANIQATLSSKTTVLAAANPKFGRFDPHGILAEQIDLPPTLINRFDLIFPIKDMPDVEGDEKLASHILQLHKNPDVSEPPVDTSLLKKYIAYARQKCHPQLTDSAINEIKEFYVQMRNRENSDERAARSIPISARQLEALVRLAEAHAKVRLMDKVTKKDARKAIELLMYCLLQVGLDRETGKIDIDRIATGIGASQRERIHIIREILSDLEGQLGKTIPLEDIQRLAKEKGMSTAEVEEIIEKLKRSGDVFEPRYGFLSRV